MQHAIRHAPLGISERPLSPEQILAAAVFGQAVVDARNAGASETCRGGARAFLTGRGDVFAFWASVAGLGLEMLQQRARESLTASAPRRNHPRGPHERRAEPRYDPNGDASSAGPF